ncbi:hypothetical protein TB2_000356 [Malus domestica]
MDIGINSIVGLIYKMGILTVKVGVGTINFLFHLPTHNKDNLESYKAFQPMDGSADRIKMFLWINDMYKMSPANS